MSTTQLQYVEILNGLLQVIYGTAHLNTTVYIIDGISEEFDYNLQKINFTI